MFVHENGLAVQGSKFMSKASDWVRMLEGVDESQVLLLSQCPRSGVETVQEPYITFDFLESDPVGIMLVDEGAQDPALMDHVRIPVHRFQR